MTRMVVQRLEEMKLGYVRLHGGVPTAKRGALMDRFRDDDAVRVFVSTDAGGVGLNLQSASVLINLDVPWNPAVLEQRNSRVHRLGQSRQVQIITMVAAGGYEEQVLGLVKTKQNLFDNVIGEDAAEDVVGVSKKMLEALIEDLADEKPSTDGGGGPKAVAPVEETGDADEKAAAHTVDPALDAAIARCIDALQQSFGPRIDRIFASAGGLFVVLDQVDAAADKVAEGLSADIPVALIDPLALKGLQRLGAASPLAGAKSCYDAADSVPADGLSRLRRLADEKLKAAAVLLDQNMTESALDLVVTALMSAASDMAGKTAPVPPQEAGIWLFGEAVPAGVIDGQEAGLIMKSIGLAQGKMVPSHLVEELVQDAARFINGV
jgi:hypothetical protein